MDDDKQAGRYSEGLDLPEAQDRRPAKPSSPRPRRKAPPRARRPSSTNGRAPARADSAENTTRPFVMDKELAVGIMAMSGSLSETPAAEALQLAGHVSPPACLRIDYGDSAVVEFFIRDHQIVFARSGYRSPVMLCPQSVDKAIEMALSAESQEGRFTVLTGVVVPGLEPVDEPIGVQAALIRALGF